MAVTQFESTGARRAFPCWDEPFWKARFTIAVAHNPIHAVLANMPSNVDPEVEYVIFTDWARPELVEYTDYSNKFAPRAIKHMEDYTAQEYSLDKLDQIAVPDFAAGAMENWGLVTYSDGRETTHPMFNQVDSPGSINANFDTIAYSKGASVIRMMQHFLGEDVFQTGIKMQFGNADKEDLWRIMEAAIPADEKLNASLAAIMNTWVEQSGYPVITVTIQAGTATAT
ncbi:hypothetical protein B566_EDAN008555, partial [Ephemera danica]